MLSGMVIASVFAVAFGRESSLSDVQKLKAENYLLKRRLLTSECQAGIQQLEAERMKLEADFITTEKCEAGWNWDTLGCAKLMPSTPEGTTTSDKPEEQK